MKKKKLEVDDSKPLSEAFLIDRASKSKVDYVSGDIVTRFGYSKVEAMTMEDFITYRLPELKRRVAEADRLAVIRDMAAGRASLINGDCVLCYTLNQMQEVSLEDLRDQLTKDNQVELIPEVQWPLVGYIKGEDCIRVTVSMPSQRLLYHNGDYCKQIWLPPLWFNVKLSLALGMLQAKLAVVPSSTPHTLDTQLKWWPLGNSSISGGRLCFGSSQVQSPLPENATLGEVIAAAFAQFTGAELNADLSWELNWDMIKDAYLQRFGAPSRVPSGTTALQHALARILEDPSGWLLVQFPALRASTRGFIYDD